MGLEKVVDRIVSESLAEEERIVSEAEAEREQILREAARRRDEILGDYMKRIEEAVRQLKLREDARTEVEIKKELLSARKRILDRAFEAVLEHFASLPDDTKRRCYSAMLKQVVAELPRGVIHCRAGEERFFSGIPGVTIGEPVSTIGGFIAESTDGSVVLEMRFEDLLHELWNRNAATISSVLFDENGESR